MLTWFVSPVGIPCRPWVEAAYRNGVKIIGTVFTDGPGFVALTQKDAAGNNPASPRTSLAVFAPNLTFNGGLNSFNSNPANYQNFYNTEVRLFAGDDLDITTADARGCWALATTSRCGAPSRPPKLGPMPAACPPPAPPWPPTGSATTRPA